jgi:hypothetical protein
MTDQTSAEIVPVAWRIRCTINGATGYLYTESLPFEPGPGVTVRSEPEPLIEGLSAEKAGIGALDREEIAKLRPVYVSALARGLASDAFDDLEGEPRSEDRTYYLARWFDAALNARALAAESTVARLTSERDEARKMLSMAQGTMALEGLNIDTHATMVELTKETMAKLITAESERDEARKEVEAERERCANVVRQHLVGWTLTPNGLAREDTAEQILEGILHPTQSDVGGSPVRDERP